MINNIKYISLVKYLFLSFCFICRAISGICKSTLIINFPGSKKASQECFEIIETALPHALNVLRDVQKDVKTTHQEIQGHFNKGCHHNHSNVNI